MPFLRPTPALVCSCLVAFLLSVGLHSKAQEVPVSEDYVLRTWDVNDGLPYNHISRIAQTPDGYLWIATWSWGGLARFDGARFVRVTSISSPQKPDPVPEPTQTIFTARDGTLWVGLERGGLARRVGGCFQTVVPFGELGNPAGWINSVVEDSSGNIWFTNGMARKVFQWRQGKLAQMPSPPEEIGNITLHSDAAGHVWFSSKESCGFYEADRVRVVDRGAPLGGRLAPAKAGGMWAARDTQLVLYGENGNKEVVADFPWKDKGGGVNLLYSDRQGDLWIGTRSHGLFRYHEGQFERMPTSHSAILSLSEDREGNLWVGTEGGLNRLHPSAFSLRQRRNGLSHDSVVSLCEDGEGRLWLATVDGLPARATDSSNQQFAPLSGWEEGAVMTVCSDPAGGVWLGILGQLVRWENGAFSRANLSENITALQPNGRDLWISTTQGGLIRRDQSGNVERFPTSGGLVLPRALAVDNSVRLWVGTEAGRVFHQEKGEFVPVDLPKAHPGGMIRFIVPDEKDTVWIGAFGSGLYRWRNGQVSRLPQNAGLPVGDLRCLIIEPNGDFWFGCGNGLFQVARKEIESVMNGERPSMHLTAFGRNQGVPGTEYSFGFRNTVARTRDGHLWFATYNGALEVSPQKLPKAVKPVPVLIEEAQVGETSDSVLEAKVVLPPRAGPLLIRYTQPQLSAPEQIQFRYRIVENGEGDWIEAGAQRTATFPRLYAGNYRFEVQASDATGQWIGQSASLGITVRAAWWETGWFRFLCALVMATGVAFLARYVVHRRMRARIRRLEAANALERERSRIARDMHDELGAGLTRIALMTELAADDPGLPTETGEQLGAISQSARAVVRTLDEIVWTINPRNDTLDRLVGFISESTRAFLSLTPLQFELELPASIPSCPVSSDTRHHVILAVKEAVNNSVKYAEANAIRMRVAIEEGSLQVAISDNGKGFDPAQVADSSNGLRNSRERMAAVGGSYSIESRPGEGTTVTLRLPISK